MSEHDEKQHDIEDVKPSDADYKNPQDFEQPDPQQNVSASSLYGLVRDADGRPVCDDLKTMPRHVWDNELSDEDREYLTNEHGADNIPTGV